MTVETYWDMKCPKCSEDSSIDIVANVSVRLCENGTDVDEARNGDHVWGGESLASCGCGFNGTVDEFEIPAQSNDLNSEGTPNETN